MVLCKDELYLFIILIITASKAITQFWRRQKSPVLSDWLDLVEVHSMERTTYEIKRKSIHFEKI